MRQSRGFTIVKYVGIILGILLSYAFASEWNSSSRQPDLIQAIQDRNLSLTHQLVDQGSDVNQRTPQGATPLHFAARSGQFTIAQLLLQNGADPGAIYQSEWTPLHFAAKGGHVDIADLLLQHGALVDGLDGNITPLHIAVQEHHRRMTSYLLAHGATVQTSFKEGWTALHVAAQAGDTDMTRLLLDSGAPIDATNTIGLTPLHSAALSGQRDLTSYLLSRGATCSLPIHPLQTSSSANSSRLYAALQEILQHCPNHLDS
ncbi:ankyrin repeat domain-containing protein [uncultured Nitrospira sp.]|uniref:ankyrin repeat domain-containing protein n=1 Tax=uncultured Nitrospira sp. TaxID=157176 RepID=UPI0031402A5A